MSPLEALSCSMWRVTTRRNLKQVDKKIAQTKTLSFQEMVLTHLMFPPSFSTFAPGSTRLSCRSLQNNLLQHPVDNIHLSFSSAAWSFLSFSSQALAYSPHLHWPNVIYRGFLYQPTYLRKIPGTFSIASSISSGVITLGTTTIKGPLCLSQKNTLIL